MSLRINVRVLFAVA